MNYVILKKFLTIRDCQFLTTMIHHIQEPYRDLGLIDGEKSDVWHESKRNKGMSYFYSTNYGVNSMMDGIKKELTSCTGIEFKDVLSSISTVFCKYINDGVSNPHRDRDKTNDRTLYQQYTALVLLTQPPNNKDEFFINFNKKSFGLKKEGREVSFEVKSERFYPNLTKGDLILFRNDISIHGVDPVFVNDELGRITTAFRSY